MLVRGDLNKMISEKDIILRSRVKDLSDLSEALSIMKIETNSMKKVLPDAVIKNASIMALFESNKQSADLIESLRKDLKESKSESIQRDSSIEKLQNSRFEREKREEAIFKRSNPNPGPNPNPNPTCRR